MGTEFKIIRNPLYWLVNYSLSLGICSFVQFIPLAISAASAVASHVQGNKARADARSQQRERNKITARELALYNELYKPVERRIAGLARVGSGATPAVERAAADVTQSFSGAEKQMKRGLERLGIDPSSPQYTNNLTKLAISRAAATAAAKNNARQVVTDNDFRRGMQVAQVGRNIPQSASNAYGQAAQAANGMAQEYAADAVQGAAATGALAQRAGLFGGGAPAVGAPQGGTQFATTNQGGLPSHIPGGNGWNIPQATGNTYADGGLVQGPGTETSDSIPAQLSNNEFVIPAHVVRAKGTEFFEKLISQYDGGDDARTR